MDGFDFADTDAYEGYGSKNRNSYTENGGGSGRDQDENGDPMVDHDEQLARGRRVWRPYEGVEMDSGAEPEYPVIPGEQQQQQQEVVDPFDYTSWGEPSSSSSSSSAIHAAPSKRVRVNEPDPLDIANSAAHYGGDDDDDGNAPQSWDQVRNIRDQLRNVPEENVTTIHDLSGPPGTTVAQVIEDGDVKHATHTNLRDHLYRDRTLPSGASPVPSSPSNPGASPAHNPPPPGDEFIENTVMEEDILPIPIARLTKQVERLRKGLEYALKTRYRHIRGETPLQRYTRSPYEKRAGNGMRKLKKLYELLDKFVYQRTPQQIQIHNCIIKITAQFVLCEDFRAESTDLLRRWKLERFCFMAMFMAGRRAGKTESGTQANAGLLYVSDYGLMSAAFSTQQGISNLFVGSTTRNLVQLCVREGFDSTRKIVRCSASQLTVIKYSHHGSNISHAQLSASNNVNQITGLAANISGQKGRKVNIANLDEASRIPLLIINESVAPHVTTGSVVIATSTTLGKDDPFTSIFNSDDPETKQLVLRVQFKLLCDDCQEKDLDPMQCTHLSHLSTPWQSPEYRTRAKTLMNNNKAVILREIFGGPINDSETTIIPSVLVEVFETLPRYSVTDALGPQFRRQTLLESFHGYSERMLIFSFIDPGGYSRESVSHTAICSITWIEDCKRFVVVGCASANLAGVMDAGDFFRPYFGGFQGHETYANAQHIIAVENNYSGSWGVDSISAQIRRIVPDVSDINERPPKFGVATYNQQKSDACCDLISKMHDRKMLIALEADFITVNVERIETANRIANANNARGIQNTQANTMQAVPPSGSLYEQILKELRDQMSRVRKTALGHNHWGYSGKGPKGSRQRDDEWMALTLVVYWSQQYMARVIREHDVQRAYQRVFLSEHDAQRNALQRASYFTM